MLVFIKALLLGIVEGVTEFLPVSSTGHMIIVDHFVKLSTNSEFTNAFEIIIQLGAILSVVIFFWNKIWPFSGTSQEKNAKWILWAKVFVAVLPAVVLGLKFDDLIEEKFFNPNVVTAMLIFYGVVLIVIESFIKKRGVPKFSNVENLTFPVAFIIGIFQCLAMVPGTSRSAATIIGGILLGLSRATAAEFSFFLAIPTMFGATLLKIVKSGLSFSLFEWTVISVGFVVSFVVAFAVIKWFMEYIKSRDFKIFAYYRIALGFIVLLIFYFSS